MKFSMTAARFVSAGIVLLAVATATGGSTASAQTAGTYLSACSPSSYSPLPPQIPSDAEIQQWQTQFVQGLAQALNIPSSTVQQAFTGMSRAAPLPPVQFQDPLETAASQLHVSLDSLRSAVQSADQTVLCAQAPGGGGNAFFIGYAGGPSPVNPSAFFAAVAQNLGGGLTGPQVQAAFATSAPSLPDPSQFTAQMQSQLDAFGAALGVSTDALRSALKSLASSGGCLPPNVLGGFRLATKQDGQLPQPPPGGPIIIPLADTKPPAGMPGDPADPLGLGLAPCGFKPLPS
jgi:hypothetical protein